MGSGAGAVIGGFDGGVTGASNTEVGGVTGCSGCVRGGSGVLATGGLAVGDSPSAPG